MSNPYDPSSSYALPNWQGNTYSLPRARRLFYYGAAVFFAFLAAALMGEGILILSRPSAATPPASIAFLSDVHPVVRVGLGLIVFLIGLLLLKYTVEMNLAVARTMLLIAPEGFIYTSNGGHMWSPWDNAVRIERLFILNGWYEGIMLRAPANIAGRTTGFSIFSTGILPWDRFIPLTTFGALWRTRPVANQKEIGQLVQVARKLLPAHSFPDVTSTEGALYHDIRRHAEHLFVGESGFDPHL